MVNKIFALLVGFFVVFSLLPTVYELGNQTKIQSNRHFELVHNYYTDYNFYLSRIREGLEGNLLVHEKYTSETHSGSLIQIFYLALGWIGRYVNVPWDRPGDVYHVARIVFAVLLLAVIAEFAKKSFSEERLDSGQNFLAPLLAGKSSLKSFFRQITSRSLSVSELEKRSAKILSLIPRSFSFWSILAFLLAVTASSWPILVRTQADWRFGGYMPWWSIMDSLQRITFVPHLLAGQALTIVLILILSDHKTLNKPGNWIFLGMLAFILGLIFPPGLLTVGVASFFLILFDKKFLPRLVVGIISVPSLLYLSLMVTVYPWKRLAEFDVLHPLFFRISDYFLALGPVLPLGIAGLALALINREKILRPAVVWISALIILFVGFYFVPQQSPLRFSEVAPQIPLAILATYLFYWLSHKTARLFAPVIGYLVLVILALFILLGLTQMYSSWFWQKDFVDQKLRANWPLIAHDNYIMYPLNDYVAAMVWLEVNTPRAAVVLSLPETGNYIPVYSGNTVYLGHANTIKAEDKEKIAKEFLAGTMSPAAARNWLTQSGISFVLFGPREAEVGKQADLSKYTFLKKLYSNGQFIIYQVP